MIGIPTSKLAGKILREHPNGFCGCIVEGQRAIGKTAYCLRVAKQVYQALEPELTEEKAYMKALDFCLFDIDDVLRVLKQTRKNRVVIPCIIWDDAGAFASSLLWFINLEAVTQLKSVMDTIRTAVTGFIINCPDRGSLLRNLRNYDDYIVEIVKDQGGHGKNDISKETGQPYKNYQRTARGYTSFKLPSGKRIIHKNFEDSFSCYIPIGIYNAYMEKRHLYLDKAVDIMEETKIQKLYSKKRKKLSDLVYDHELTKKIEKLKDEGIISNGEENL
jgi:hypothetical protein